MTVEQYNTLINELNFSDTRVGIYPLNLNDTEEIEEILQEFNYDVIGLYETINSKGFKFKDNYEVYSIQENKGKLDIYIN